MKKGKNYLLTIAIDQYEHLTPLNNSVKDAEEITDILTNIYQFEEPNIHRLINGEATEIGIDKKFIELIKLIKEDDNIVVYYSGHGYYREEVKEGYWIPVDGREDTVPDYISNANLIKYLQQLPAHHILLMVDACFSGSLVQQLRGVAHSEAYPSRRVFTSGKVDVVGDGAKGENSPFARGIIDFLKANREGKASTSSMIASVHSYVTRNTESQEPMQGRLKNSRDNGGEFYFTRKLTEKDLWENSLAKDTIEAYENYVKVYPDGEYIIHARERLQGVNARKAWRVAEKRNTEDDYQSFINHYSYSEYVEQARAKISQMRQREINRLQEERDQARREEWIETSKKKYRASYARATEAFQKKDYQKARVEFRKCEQSFIENQVGFIPELSEVKAKRELCSKKIDFKSYVDDGNRSYRIRDYQTAVKLYSQAMMIFPSDVEVQKMLSASRTALNVKRTIDFEEVAKKETASVSGMKGGSSKKPGTIVVQPQKTTGSGGRKAIVVKPSVGNNRPTPTNRSVIIEDAAPNNISDNAPAVEREKRRKTILIVIGLVFLYFLLCILLGFI